MPWIDFDANGIAVGVYANAQRAAQIFVATTPPDVGKYTWDGAQWNMTLSAAKQQQIAQLDAAYVGAVCAGVTSSATGTAYTYCKAADLNSANGAQADLDSAANTCALLAAGSTLDYLVTDSNGNRVSVAHTAPQLQQARLDGANRKVALINYLQQQIAAVNAATTVADVQAITWKMT